MDEVFTQLEIIQKVIDAQNEYWCHTQRSKGAVLIVDRTVYAELQAACTPANRAGGVRDEGGRLIKVSGLHICVDFAAQEKTLRIASLPSEDWFEGVLPDICALSSGPDWGEEPEREVVLGVVLGQPVYEFCWPGGEVEYGRGANVEDAFASLGHKGPKSRVRLVDMAGYKSPSSEGI